MTRTIKLTEEAENWIPLNVAIKGDTLKFGETIAKMISILEEDKPKKVTE